LAKALLQPAKNRYTDAPVRKRLCLQLLKFTLPSITNKDCCAQIHATSSSKRSSLPKFPNSQFSVTDDRKQSRACVLVDAEHRRVPDFPTLSSPLLNIPMIFHPRTHLLQERRWHLGTCEKDIGQSCRSFTRVGSRRVSLSPTETYPRHGGYQAPPCCDEWAPSCREDRRRRSAPG